MAEPDPTLDLVILGAGRRGLRAALQRRRNQPASAVAVLDALPQPGGDDRTQRSNGFSCELGAFAFARDEVEPLLTLLPAPPRLIEAGEGARRGQLWDGTGLHDTPVEAIPVSFASGNEELWQACRRELGSWLRLSRAATALRRTATGWEIDLGGEVPATLRCRELVLALPLAGTASLLAPFDPALEEVAGRLRQQAGAMVFLGDREQVGDALPGYGIAALPDSGSPLREVIHCSRVFPGRAIAGRCLLRCELEDTEPGASDDDLVTAALAELNQWLGRQLQFGFTKVHRFALPVLDGAHAECAVRLRGLPARVGALTLL
ncbi:MAG: NAD(P)-binding protein [Planctomycetes bacterium]|nr:NAD(P)-binding protein [Planctomycetota bacterium]